MACVWVLLLVGNYLSACVAVWSSVSICVVADDYVHNDRPECPRNENVLSFIYRSAKEQSDISVKHLQPNRNARNNGRK